MYPEERFREWLALAEAPEVLDELNLLQLRRSSTGITDRFFRELALTPAGMRGLMGAGTNRVNVYTVRRMTQALALHLKRRREQRPVAIACDTRQNSRYFAEECARVLAANGIFVWMHPRPMPAAALSFTVRHLHCAAGLCITAGHLPAAYNGCRLYNAEGARLPGEEARRLYKKMLSVDAFCDVATMDYDYALDIGLVRLVHEDSILQYIAAAASTGTGSEAPAKAQHELPIAYSAMNGAAGECLGRALERAGFAAAAAVPADETENAPPVLDPNEAEAWAGSLAFGERMEAELLLATDADGGRVAAMVRHGGRYVRISGNEVGVLLLDYICRRKTSAGQLPQRGVVVTSLVTTSLARQMAHKYGMNLSTVPSGFQNIAEEFSRVEAHGSGSFLLGFDETGSYLATGQVREKDGVGTAVLICEMVRDYKSRDLTLVDALEQLYLRYGSHVNTGFDIPFEGLDGALRMQRLLRKLRSTPPERLSNVHVTAFFDYLKARPGGGNTFDLLEFNLENGARVFFQPELSESRIGIYIETVAPSAQAARRAHTKLAAGVRELFEAEAPANAPKEALTAPAPAPHPTAWQDATGLQ